MGSEDKTAKNILETFEYEPIFMDFLFLDEIEARILLMVISQGGFTTKNYLEAHLSIERPTLNRKLQTLAHKRIIRQNLEFKVRRITLLANQSELKEKLVLARNQMKFAYKFIIESLEVKNKNVLRSRFKEAMNVLLPPFRHNDLLAEVLTILYIDQIDSHKTISMKNLIQALKIVDQNYSENYLVLLFSGMSSFIRIFTSKIMERSAKKTKIVRPQFPLKALSHYLFDQKQFNFSYFENTINELFSNVQSLTYDRIPHQILSFPSDLKKRINSCIPYSVTIYLLYNGIYETEGEDFLHYIINMKKLSNQNIFVLTDINIDLSEIKYPSLEIKKVPRNIGKDYLTRDIILFCRDIKDPFGAIIIPRKPLNPYYTIAESNLKEIIDVFSQNWMD